MSTIPDVADRPFKEEVNRETIGSLAAALASVDPTLDVTGFRRRAARGLADLELKARVGHIAAALAALLADRPFPAASVLVADAADAGDLGMWDGWPALTWVEEQGLDHPTAALTALRRLTSHMSAEFAVRPYLEQHPELTLSTFRRWARDPDVHVRRLVSEGSRPRLPWGRRLRAFVADPSPVVALLDLLADDDEEYVRRSVANNLNDIAKDHPEVAVAAAARWIDAAAPDRRSDAEWVAARALRSLVKAGDPGALAVLGFDHGAGVEVAAFALAPSAVDMGDDLGLSAELRNGSADEVRLVVDYLLHRVVADGSTSAKVFKWRTFTLAPGATVVLYTRHRLRPVTVRTMHPGEHVVELQVNGTVRASGRFDLRTGG